MSDQPLHAVVTGASSGIGNALARELASRGYRLSLVARRREALESLAAEVTTEAHAYPCDLSKPETCAEWVAPATEALGPVDLLVNNAGMQIVDPAMSVPIERAEMLAQLDYLVPMRLTHLLVPGMLERDRGGVINISSMAAIVPTPGMLHYNAAKAALASASETLRVELNRTGVHVLTVYPGPVSTPMESAARDRMGRGGIADKIPTGSPEGLAKKVCNAFERRKARVVYPASYSIARHVPSIAQALTNRFTPRLEKPASENS